MHPETILKQVKDPATRARVAFIFERNGGKLGSNTTANLWRLADAFTYCEDRGYSGLKAIRRNIEDHLNDNISNGRSLSIRGRHNDCEGRQPITITLENPL